MKGIAIIMVVLLVLLLIGVAVGTVLARRAKEQFGDTEEKR